MGFPGTLSVALAAVEYTILLHQLPNCLVTGNVATDKLFTVISFMPIPPTIQFRLMFTVLWHLSKSHMEASLLKHFIIMLVTLKIIFGGN